jgi:hypothetical protein
MHIDILVLKYTRTISVLKMICFFLKIKEHRDITIVRINLKKGCRIHPIFLLIINFVLVFFKL